jgi:catechol 2,3-dioxygenase-like lactoylglutathione lyase family enzyme
MVQSIDNIGICAADLGGSAQFYRRLGFAEAYRNERGVMMASGSVQLFLFQTRRSNPTPVSRELGLFGNPPGIDHISFSVAEVDALYGKLMQTGVVCGSRPEDQSWGARMFGLKDPDGNNLYLLQRF